MNKLWIDIETYSSVDLKKFGVYPYAASDDFLILMAAWSRDGKTVQTALDREEIANIPGLWDPSVLKVAHNAQFERVCFSNFCGELFLPPSHWHDTQAIAAELGWPKKLETLAKALGVDPKDEAGTRLINLFCKPNRKGTRTLPEEKPIEWMDFIAYCEQDVYTLIEVDQALGDWPTETERKVFLADQTINDRGIAIDVDMARHAVIAGEQNQREQKARVTELSGVENPGSVQQMSRWLKSQGVKIPNLRAETVERLLSDDLQEDIREVLELRQELALAAPAKFSTALSCVLEDQRLHGTLAFFGAHTGRWAGRGTQLQNLPRLAFKTDAETEAAILDLQLGLGASSEDLKKLVRPLFRGPFTVVDYSAIEARVIAWLAGEEWALDAFRAGRDIYVETAERMSTPGHQLDRSQGKVAVLALGYNGGLNSLRAMGADGTDDELWALVKQWRRANRRIERLWTDLGNAFGDGGKVGPHLRVNFSKDKLGTAAHLQLPSGRPITYHDVRWERYFLIDPKTRERVFKEGWRFANPKNPWNKSMRIGTYGGRLSENATQAVARDIMAEAILRLEEAGYPVVGHVHDEIIVEGKHDVETISKIMCEPPSWADGLPINGEGYNCRRYKKA